MSMPNQIIDELVRDLTKVGSIPKSEARRMPSQQVILKALTSKKTEILNNLDKGI